MHILSEELNHPNWRKIPLTNSQSYFGYFHQATFCILHVSISLILSNYFVHYDRLITIYLIYLFSRTGCFPSNFWKRKWYNLNTDAFHNFYFCMHFIITSIRCSIPWTIYIYTCGQQISCFVETQKYITMFTENYYGLSNFNTVHIFTSLLNRNPPYLILLTIKTNSKCFLAWLQYCVRTGYKKTSNMWDRNSVLQEVHHQNAGWHKQHATFQVHMLSATDSSIYHKNSTLKL